jgi:proline dehydrogenase
MVGYSWLLASGTAFIRLFRFLHLPYAWLLRPVYKQFCGGETLHDCTKITQTLSEHGVYSILDYSAEGSSTEESYRSVFDEVIKSIEYSASNTSVPFAVFKPSGLISSTVLKLKAKRLALSVVEEDSLRLFTERVDDICAAASRANVRLLIDAEDYSFQDMVDDMAHSMMEKYNREKAVVFNTVQLYRTGRLEYLKELHKTARDRGFRPGFKLVRGAYMEKERKLALANDYKSPIHSSKEETDRDFNQAVEYCIANIGELSVFCGTHNVDSCLLMTSLMEKHGIPSNHPEIWFAQLFGMSDPLSFNLAAEKFNTAKYIPYGRPQDVMPYLLRRAAENSSVKGQSGRELQNIRKEILRRKNNTL